MKTFETQVGGTHYQRLAIQPTEYIVKNQLAWREGNVIKYITRAGHKDGESRLKDLLKAQTYLRKLIHNESTRPSPGIS